MGAGASTTGLISRLRREREEHGIGYCSWCLGSISAANTIRCPYARCERGLSPCTAPGCTNFSAFDCYNVIRLEGDSSNCQVRRVERADWLCLKCAGGIGSFQGAETTDIGGLDEYRFAVHGTNETFCLSLMNVEVLLGEDRFGSGSSWSLRKGAVAAFECLKKLPGRGFLVLDVCPIKDAGSATKAVDILLVSEDPLPLVQGKILLERYEQLARQRLYPKRWILFEFSTRERRKEQADLSLSSILRFLIPTDDPSTTAISVYLADALARLSRARLPPILIAFGEKGCAALIKGLELLSQYNAVAEQEPMLIDLVILHSSTGVALLPEEWDNASKSIRGKFIDMSTGDATPILTRSAKIGTFSNNDLN